MNQTLAQQAYTRNNDYGHLEAVYHRVTAGELVRDPYSSVHYSMPELTFSASLIVPARNERATIVKCLISIEQSTFNRRYPWQLEVIAVDDGSDDGTWELLERLQFDLHLKVIKQPYPGRACNQNFIISLTDSDVIIFLSKPIIVPTSTTTNKAITTLLEKLMLELPINTTSCLWRHPVKQAQDSGEAPKQCY